ncbi:MAG: HEAT repeat domain-containing protein [Terriglobales bacterium]
MRITVITLAILAAITTVRGQQTLTNKSNRAELLTLLRSNNAEVRSEALDQLRTDPVALRDPKVKAALVNQLDRENQEPLYAEEEDYASYVSWLADTVAKVVDWSDHREVCILAYSVDLPEELADHAKVAIPCLLQRFKTAPSLLRGDVVAMLVQALAKGRNDLDAATTQTVHHTILSALHDSDYNVRADTVRALGKFGGEDMIPVLEEVSKTDTSVDKLDHNLWIREYAVKAIAAIRKRVAATSATTPQK